MKMRNESSKRIVGTKKYGTLFGNLEIIIRHMSKVPLTLIYFLSFLVPRDKKVWVFGSWDGTVFLDNAKYLFLYTNDKNKNSNMITPVWISRNRDVVKELNKRGYKSYYMYSFKGIYYSLKAKYIIVDHDVIDTKYTVNWWLSGGSIKFQLFHGVAIKKIGYDVKLKPQVLEYLREVGSFFLPWLPPLNKGFYDCVLSPSEFYAPICASAFAVDEKRILIAGYPRNDILFENIENWDICVNTYICAQIIKKKLEDSTCKIIGYFPTFRDYGGNIFIDGKFDLIKLNNFLESNNIYLIIKYHQVGESAEEYAKYKNLQRIIFLPNNFDAYPIFKHIDILITDYSSISIDFLLLNKPVIFFPFDIQKYISKDRELYFDYDEFTPGPKAYTFNELLEWINYFINGNDEFSEKREKIRDLTFKYVDGNFSKRIYDFILRYSES